MKGNCNEAQIDALMSLIPEAAFQRMAIGTPCMNKDGKLFTVLGVYAENCDEEKDYANINLYPNWSEENPEISLAGLYYDPEKP